MHTKSNGEVRKGKVITLGNNSNVTLDVQFGCHLAFIFLVLVIKSQVANLTPNFTFGHNFEFKTPNGKYEPLLIFTLQDLSNCIFGTHFSLHALALVVTRVTIN